MSGQPSSSAGHPRPKVVLNHPFAIPSQPDVVREILGPMAQLYVVTERGPLLSALSDARGLIALLSLQVDAELLDAAPSLRVVGNFAVGTDNIDLDACQARGIAVVNTPDVLTRSTAECTLALLLAAARRFPEGDALCRANAFTGWAPDLLLGHELHGRRAVLLGGRGRIGAAVAALFTALGMQVQNIARDDDDASIARKLKGAQVLSLHAPLTPQTRGWLSAERLALLPPDAIVLNTARGPLVDEEALAAALRDRRIFAAGLDVYAREPEIPAALRALDNAVLLPHLGSATEQARVGMARSVASGVAAILRGENPPNRVC